MSKQELLTPDVTTNQVCTVIVEHVYRNPSCTLTQPHGLSPGRCLYLRSSGFHGGFLLLTSVVPGPLGERGAVGWGVGGKFCIMTAQQKSCFPGCFKSTGAWRTFSPKAGDPRRPEEGWRGQPGLTGCGALAGFHRWMKSGHFCTFLVQGAVLLVQDRLLCDVHQGLLS